MPIIKLTNNADDYVDTDEGHIIQARDGDDIVNGAGGADDIDGGAGNDNLLGGDGADTLSGGLGNDVLDGNAGSDVLYGGDGDDQLHSHIPLGSADFDSLAGGAGNDTYFLDRRFSVLDTEGVNTVYSSSTFLTSDLETTRPGYNNVIVGDLYLTGTDSIDGSGGDLDNSIYGNSADNLLRGWAGDDHLYGGDGDDILAGSSGNDWLEGGTGQDTAIFTGAPSSYVIRSVGVNSYTVTDNRTGYSEGVDTVTDVEILSFPYLGTISLSTDGPRAFIYGSSSNDVVSAAKTIAGQPKPTDGSDIIYTFGGNDIIDGGAGADIMFGGDGNDTYIVEDAGDQVFEADVGGDDIVKASISYTLPVGVETLILTGTGAIDGTGNYLNNKITGNEAANVLIGYGGNDSLLGMGGDDVLWGSENGNDKLDGGAGNDLMHGDLGGDLILGGAGNDTSDYQDSSEAVTIKLGALTGGYVVGAGGDAQGDRLQSVENILGSAYSDTLVGDKTANQLVGNNGADVLKGGGGDDLLQGGADDDILQGGAGDDIVDGGDGSDNLSGAQGSDQLIGGLGEDKLDGGQGADLLDGGDGADSLNGGSENDALWGGAGADKLDGGTGADEMHGGADNDIYVVDNLGDQVVEAADEGVDLVNASVSFSLGSDIERLTLTGTADIDGAGNALDNVIKGNVGNNILTGGAGKDTLTGGAGQDTFVFGPAVAEDADKIVDFVQGVDRLAFNASDFGLPAGALDAANLVFGAAATDAHAEFIYDAAHKTLLWDADGAGGAAAVTIATFASAVTLAASDFLIL